MSLKAEIDKSMDSTKNFQNYKDLLKTINPPCVPFFGTWPYFAGRRGGVLNSL